MQAEQERERWVQWRRMRDLALAQEYLFVFIMCHGGALADERLLGGADRARARRLLRPQDRLNLILGRTLIHHLAHPEGSAAKRELCVGDYGKPYIVGAFDFNLSHSGAYVACALSAHGPVGVDIEIFDQVQPSPELLSLMTHRAERAVLAAQNPVQSEILFRRCRTRKEAVLKLLGIGLIDDLPSIDVKLDQYDPLLSAPAAIRCLDIHDPLSRFSAALAANPTIRGALVCLVDARAQFIDHWSLNHCA